MSEHSFPLDIFACCDTPGCGAETLVWSGDPDGYLTAERQLPPDWSAIGERTYCPRCSRDDPLPHRVAAQARASWFPAGVGSFIRPLWAPCAINALDG
jgi:hypothetical protein